MSSKQKRKQQSRAYARSRRHSAHDQQVQLAHTPGKKLEYKWIIMAVSFLMLFTCRKENRNCNTSGVVTLLEILRTLPENQRHKVCFVLFDLEEAGLLGSAAFASKHKAAMKDKLLINFDCVSDGEHVIFALRPKAKDKADLLGACYPSTEAVQCEVLTKGVFYPSDQAAFVHGVGVCALKKSKLFGWYMDRIHTKRDTVLDETNIDLLRAGTVRLVQAVTTKEETHA